MKLYKLLLMSALALGAFISVRDVHAQAPSWNHKAIITLYRQAEIPGRILPPGTYVFKLLVPEGHVGQVLNEDETEVFGIFFTMTADRKIGTDLDTRVILDPRGNGSVKWDRVVGWFSPGEQVGDEISYEKYKPVAPAAS